MTGQHRIGTARQPRPHTKQLGHESGEYDGGRHDDADGRTVQRQGNEDSDGKDHFGAAERAKDQPADAESNRQGYAGSLELQRCFEK